jgi:Asp-tRNA(Asn)/Glu-tRNA(Gln) amidotransferase A subunit family amidase
MSPVSQHLRRIAEQDLRLRAFACVGAADGAAAGAADDPTDEVLLGVKDLFDVAGLPTTLGTVAVPARVVTETAAAVTALQRWGAVVVGKTVTSEFAYGCSPSPRRSTRWAASRARSGSPASRLM